MYESHGRLKSRKGPSRCITIRLSLNRGPCQQALKRTFSLQRTSESLGEVGSLLFACAYTVNACCVQPPLALGLEAQQRQNMTASYRYCTYRPTCRRWFLHSSLSPPLGQTHFKIPFYGRRSGPARQGGGKRWTLRYQLSRVVKNFTLSGL